MLDIDKCSSSQVKENQVWCKNGFLSNSVHLYLWSLRRLTEGTQRIWTWNSKFSLSCLAIIPHCKWIYSSSAWLVGKAIDNDGYVSIQCLGVVLIMLLFMVLPLYFNMLYLHVWLFFSKFVCGYYWSIWDLFVHIFYSQIRATDL